MQTLLDAVVVTGDGSRHTLGRVLMAVSVLIDIVIVTTATVQIKGRIAEGEQDVLLQLTNVNSGAAAVNVTASGLFRVDASGLESIMARVNAWTAGAVTVKTKSVIG